jgi:hypothetical protein
MVRVPIWQPGSKHGNEKVQSASGTDKPNHLSLPVSPVEGFPFRQSRNLVFYEIDLAKGHSELLRGFSRWPLLEHMEIKQLK